MVNVNIIMDMQFGSTGKGSLAYLLGLWLKPDVAVTAWGPNAGHTSMRLGKKYVHTMLANSMLCDSVSTQVMGPGSVVNLASLMSECTTAYLDKVWIRKTIIIHPMACILRQDHADVEQELTRIGSTMKGTAAAAIEKIWRDPDRSPLARDFFRSASIVEYYQNKFYEVGIRLYIQEYDYRESEAGILVEGSQGY